MGHNNESSHPERRHDSFSCRQPKEGDFIMSASAPFASSIFLNPRTTLPGEATKERRETSNLTVRPPRGTETRLNRNASVCNTSAVAAAEVVEPNAVPTEETRQEAATPPLLTKSAHAARGAPLPHKLTPLTRGLQLTALTEGAGQRTAMSPVSAAGRMAYVADVTARVHRMRARGRRVPETAVPHSHSSAINSEDGSPRSLNLPSPPTATNGFHLPRLPVSSPKRKH